MVLIQVLSAIAFGLLLAGCGGGGDEPLAPRAQPVAAAIPAARPAPLTAPLTSVRLEGCVVDEFFQSRAGTDVRALASDGRLIGNAHSDARGTFTQVLPARQTVSIAVDKPGGDALRLVTARSSGSLDICLIDPETCVPQGTAQRGPDAALRSTGHCERNLS